MNRLRRVRGSGQDAFTLIELLVTMGLFSIILAVFGAGVDVMFKDVRRSQGQSDNLDGSRRVVQLMDKQVRYANAINPPGAGAVAGATYVEWRQGLDGKRQTCVQWRSSPDGTLAYRTWKPILATGQTLETTPFVVRADGVTPPASGAVFALPTAVELMSLTKQKLTVAFRSTHGKPALTTDTRVSLTALNTLFATPPTSLVCQEVPRA